MEWPPAKPSCFSTASLQRISTIEALRDRGWQFYTFIGGGARFMFAWDTAPQRVDELAADLRQIALA